MVTAALFHFRGNGPGHHIPGSQFLHGMIPGHEPFSPGVVQEGARTPDRFRNQEAGPAGNGQGRGMELDEFHIHQFRSRPAGQSQAAAGGPLRIGGVGEEPSHASRGQYHPIGRQTDRPPLVECHGALAAALPDQEIRYIAVFQGGDPFFFPGNGPESPGHFRPGTVPIGVDDPVPAVAAFPSQGQGPVRIFIEPGPVMEQVQHRIRPFRHHDPGHGFIGQAGSRHQG